jgi:hypothetical protein
MLNLVIGAFSHIDAPLRTARIPPMFEFFALWKGLSVLSRHFARHGTTTDWKRALCILSHSMSFCFLQIISRGIGPCAQPDNISTRDLFTPQVTGSSVPLGLSCQRAKVIKGCAQRLQSQGSEKRHEVAATSVSFSPPCCVCGFRSDALRV